MNIPDGDRVRRLADFLVQAERSKTGVESLTDQYPDITPEEAYQIQLANVQRKMEVGQSIVGKKIGLTSLVMQQTFGVNEPDYGHLLDSMLIPDTGSVSFDRVFQPKVEGEIAFVLKRR